MRVLALADMSARDIRQFGSAGFGILPLSTQAHVVLAKLAPGGTIGRHPAVVDQCLIVVDGEAEVSGEDGISRVVQAGSAVFWATDESHETLSRNGLTALIIEGAGVIEALT